MSVRGGRSHGKKEVAGMFSLGFSDGSVVIFCDRLHWETERLEVKAGKKSKKGLIWGASKLCPIANLDVFTSICR